jgi:hypothetical protein
MRTPVLVAYIHQKIEGANINSPLMARILLLLQQ